MLNEVSFVDMASPKQRPVFNKAPILTSFSSSQYSKNAYRDKSINKRHNEFIMAIRAWVMEMQSKVKKNTANKAMRVLWEILLAKA